jgi:hypothetical protein
VENVLQPVLFKQFILTKKKNGNILAILEALWAKEWGEEWGED